MVRWTAAGLEYEADPRQAEKLLRDLKLDGEGVKSASTPGVEFTKEQVDADKALEASKTSPYRAVAARANDLASDRPDAQVAGKEACRCMSGCRNAQHRLDILAPRICRITKIKGMDRRTTKIKTTPAKAVPWFLTCRHR